MRTLVSLIVLMVGAVAFAAPQNYKIDMEVFVDGKRVSKPSVTLQEGTKGSVTTKKPNGEETTLEVTAKDGNFGGVDGILTEMQVSYSDGFGKRRVLAKPRLLSKDGGSAQVIINDKESGQDVVIKAVTTRVR